MSSWYRAYRIAAGADEAANTNAYVRFQPIEKLQYTNQNIYLAKHPQKAFTQAAGFPKVYAGGSAYGSSTSICKHYCALKACDYHNDNMTDRTVTTRRLHSPSKPTIQF
jgi:hypothetical protein